MELCEEITAGRKDEVVGVGRKDEDTASHRLSIIDGKQAQANCPKQVGVSCG
jgi:hypothetical protein